MADKTGKALQGAGTGAAAGAAFGPWGAAIGGGIGLLGGLAGNDDNDKANAIQQDIYNQYANLQLPDIEKQKLALLLQQSAGNLNPQSEQAQQLGAHDAYQDIAVDPRLRTAQTNNLELLSKIASSGGLTPQDQAALNDIRRQTEADTNARVQQQLQNQQARGVGTSDSALAARMLQDQSGANRQSQQADNQASMAFQRALQAAQGAGTLGAQMENTQYQQQANLANAMNTREGTNMQQRAGANMRNVDAFNQAQRYNLSNDQNIANTNVGTQNAQQQYNKELQQKQYDNQLRKLSGMQGQGTNASTALMNQGDRRANQFIGAGEGIAKGIGAYMGGQDKVATQNEPGYDSPGASKPQVRKNLVY